jgi:LysM repeat protein
LLDFSESFADQLQRRNSMAIARFPHRRRMATISATLVLALLVALLPATALAAPNESSTTLSGWGCSAYYTVHRGDTLSSIARWYGVSVQALAQANHIWNVNRIYAGQVLCIPYAGGGGGVTHHVVRYGQTLSGIAAYYGTTTACLAQVNGIWNPNRIYVGQVLRIAYC